MTDIQPTNPAFPSLADEQFMNLTSYRRSGDPVVTCVWFAQAGDRLYVQTWPGAGKIKRIRNSGVVELAASDSAGHPHGPSIRAHARVLDDEAEREHAEAVLKAKYGVLRDQMISRMGHGEMNQRVYIEIEPTAV